MKKRWKIFLGIIILALLIVGAVFGYRQYQSSKILGVYKFKATKAVKKEKLQDLFYLRLKKNQRVETIYLAHKYKGVNIPTLASTGTWHYSNSKKDKITIVIDSPLSKKDKDSETFKVNKNGSLVGSNDYQLIKTTDFSEKKFERDYQKYKKQTTKLVKQMNQQNAKEDSSDSTNSNSSDQPDDSSASSTHDSTADPDTIGRAIYARVFPGETVDTVEQDGDRYDVSNEYHSADSTIPFQINGNTVTYWTQADGDTTANGKNDAHTVSIDELLGN